MRSFTVNGFIYSRSGLTATMTITWWSYPLQAVSKNVPWSDRRQGSVVHKIFTKISI